jgi:hypothetical protein
MTAPPPCSNRQERGGLTEQYGYMAVFLRLKGIVPPSTEAMNAR